MKNLHYLMLTVLACISLEISLLLLVKQGYMIQCTQMSPLREEEAYLTMKK